MNFLNASQMKFLIAKSIKIKMNVNNVMIITSLIKLNNVSNTLINKLLIVKYIKIKIHVVLALVNII